MTFLQRSVLALLLIAAGAVGAGQDTVTDDAGRTLAADPPARRIVALAPHLAELVHAAGAGAALVGAVRFSDYPAAVRSVPSVGDANGIDVERVLALRPTLVLAWSSGNRPADLARLEALGLRVFRSEPRTLEDVASTLRRIGRLAGTAQTAEAAIGSYQAALARATRTAPQGRAPLVFIQIWDTPPMTVSGAHLISRVVERCGGRNAFAALPVLAGSVSLESMVAADPEVVVAAVESARAHAIGATWQRWPKVKAVAAGRVHVIDPDLVTRATPRIAQGVAQVCAWIAQAAR
jgi:iron complex transport system substrate-binding protein